MLVACALQAPPAERGRFRDGAGVPTDLRATDRIVELAAERGLSLLPVVLRAPDWAARVPGEWASPSADPRTYATDLTGERSRAKRTSFRIIR